jgi:8-oxo-dGTP diphosphatase
MKDRKDKSRAPILAAGGIVLRGDRRPQFAIVQLRKLGVWVLPKGKLAANEDAMAAARREVLEETGHRVTIHEFLGTLAYEASRRPKVVQFWRMHAIGEPIRELMRDVRAIQWLALEDAIDQLTHLRERAFLEQVGPIALKSAERSARRAASGERLARKNLIERAPSTARGAVVERGEPFPPVVGPIESVEPIEQDVSAPSGLGSATPIVAPTTLVGIDKASVETAARNMLGKTWVWFRHAALPYRGD